jgi:alkanesulfonate monooxygenase SsuD/methylene tetrahydromethanopterin reductase-like flavin-dependent oxidoreductase (luciferase family)
MRFGVIDHLDRGGADLSQYYDDRLRLAEIYESAGLYAYHVAEHHGTPLGMAPSPSVFLAALAQRTSRLRLGPMVYCLPMYNPLRLIEEICMLDHLSRGRFQLGVGRGISPVEAGFYNVNPAETPAMYREALDFIRKGLAGGDFTYEGRYYRAADMPMVLRPFQKPHPPLWYGTASPEAADWAAEGRVNLISNQPPARVREITDRYRARWAALGRSERELPLLGYTCHLVVADTGDQARAIARRAYRVWRSSFMFLWDRAGRAPQTVSYPEEFDALAERRLGLAGDPDEVSAAIADLRRDTGANYFVARLAFGDLSPGESARSVSLLRDAVFPRLLAAA